ncbi:MAG: uracil-DNA glycosylase family protein [Bacteroidales bacterium]|nr:uracil-DNA glycosylase family protein [Bacteroidales bacterium]MCF8390226.1 uracil-DNA glycosylase family protein [Bacteroidales bacterium]
MTEFNVPSKKALRKMGYLSDQAGIVNRYFREEGNWHSHIDNCHAFILQEITKAKPKQILVLGSGWLLDFPIDSEQIFMIDISLADIHHPRQIRHKINKLNNVELIEADVTGGLIEKVFLWVQEARKSGKRPDISEWEIPLITFCKDYDYVISLNILNQLDILLVDYIRKFWDFSDEEILSFRKRIQNAHTSIFNSSPGILISDIKELQKDKKGRVVNEKKLIFADFPKAKTRKSWVWNFDTNFAYNNSYQIDMAVDAISF